MDIFKLLDILLLEDMNGYFKRHQHEIRTRGNGSCVVLPKLHTETGKSHLPTRDREPAFLTDSKKTTRDEISILLFRKLTLPKSL